MIGRTNPFLMRDGGDKKKLHHIPGLRNNSGNFSIFAAIRRASSLESNFATGNYPASIMFSNSDCHWQFGVKK